MQETISVEFYPSHLYKGLIAGGLSLLSGSVAIILGGYAMRELSLIGQDVYPEVTLPKVEIPK
jgi:hypothetical protein